MTCPGDAPLRLWLVRHAQPLVGAGVCYGASDIPADAALTLQAAQALAQALPTGVQIFNSPLQRCQQLTHQLQALRPDLKPVLDVRLREMDFGAWEGRLWANIERPELDGWTADFAHWRCGGAESVHDLMTRVAQVWDEARASPHPVAWITHAGVIRAATLLAQNLRQIQRADQWPRAAIAFGQIQAVCKMPQNTDCT